MLKKKLEKLYFRYFYNESLKKLLADAKVNTPSSVNNSGLSKPKSKVLFQAPEDYYYAFLFSIVSEGLSAYKEIEPYCYSNRALRPASFSSMLSFLKAAFYHNSLTDRLWFNTYQKFLASVKFRFNQLSAPHVALNRLLEARSICKKLHSKQDVLVLEIDGIKVGDLIYDTYLRFKPSATIDTNHWYLSLVVYQCLKCLHVSKHFFENSQIDMVVTSYTTYLDHGVVARLAIKQNIPVYSFGAFAALYKYHNSDLGSHATSHGQYSRSFETMSEVDQLKALDRASIGLNNRLSGKIDAATFYMKQSAYKESEVEMPDVAGRVVIFLHDFFDSPHIYDWMLFPDFYEWITYTLDFAAKKKIPIAVKPHPNQIKDSENVVEKLKLTYPEVLFLPTEITNKQLVDADIACGLTVYGTVVHELNFMGKPCIACADHPSISFDESLTARTLSQYDKLLENFNCLVFDADKACRNSLAFYYCRNLCMTDEEQALQTTLLKYRKQLTGQPTDDLHELFNEFKQELLENPAFQSSISQMGVL